MTGRSLSGCGLDGEWAGQTAVGSGRSLDKGWGLVRGRGSVRMVAGP